MIGRMHHVIFDCPDPAALAEFYSALLGHPVTYRRADFVVVARDDHTSGLAFQRVPDHVPPAWPDPARSQQVHLDVMVDDLAGADPLVQALGARPLGRHRARRSADPAHEPGYWVYADPAGHPFCLVPRPSWAEPVGGPTGR